MKKIKISAAFLYLVSILCAFVVPQFLHNGLMKDVVFVSGCQSLILMAILHLRKVITSPK